ncbi:MAG: hypothetical protein VXW94_04730, partial [Pseudomonadota bacterium]|nr:hypothetical protein [Pseudomonadota bacterium]
MYKPLGDFILLVLMSSSAFSDNLYRYKNDVGGTVVDWHVPAEYAGRGYEVLNAQGEVVEVVPRQLSAEELQNKDLVERLQQDAEVEGARLAEWDKFLLLRYSSVEDIDAAQERALRELKIRLRYSQAISACLVVDWSPCSLGLRIRNDGVMRHSSRTS